MHRLIHSTNINIANYLDFDLKFPKFPQGYRKSAVTTALSIVSQHYTRISQGKKSTLNFKQKQFPIFYNKESVISGGSDPLHLKIKVYKDKDWKYIPIKIKKTDLLSRFKHLRDPNSKSKNSSKLHINNGKLFITTYIETNSKLSNKSLKEQRVLGVDLGINNDAVCSILDYTGTIHGRKFINFPYEKDQLRRILNSIRINQRHYKSSNNVKKLWRKFHNKTQNHAILIVRSIIQYAIENNIDVIVLEHLDFRSSKQKSNKSSKDSRVRLQYWRCRDIFKRISHHAHLHGIRVKTVYPNGTSSQAFDGSGEVTRHKDNHSICTFPNKKVYNCDLNASYNIGSRYFLREIRNTLGPIVLAKVPGISQVKITTLSTLRMASSLI